MSGYNRITGPSGGLNPRVVGAPSMPKEPKWKGTKLKRSRAAPEKDKEKPEVGRYKSHRTLQDEIDADIDNQEYRNRDIDKSNRDLQLARNKKEMTDIENYRYASANGELPEQIEQRGLVRQEQDSRRASDDAQKFSAMLDFTSAVSMATRNKDGMFPLDGKAAQRLAEFTDFNTIMPGDPTKPAGTGGKKLNVFAQIVGSGNEQVVKFYQGNDKGGYDEIRNRGKPMELATSNLRESMRLYNKLNGKEKKGADSKLEDRRKQAVKLMAEKRANYEMSGVKPPADDILRNEVNADMESFYGKGWNGDTSQSANAGLNNPPLSVGARNPQEPAPQAAGLTDPATKEKKGSGLNSAQAIGLAALGMPNQLLGQYAAKGVSGSPKNTPQEAAQPAPKGQVVQAPPNAIKLLQQNPQFKDKFLEKYGYLPEGM